MVFQELTSAKGSVNYVPVHFLYNSIDPDELTALYTTADVCFISSTRDGMNLVCYEFVACHNEEAIQSSREAISQGVVILSEFTGAASVLEGFLKVNPWDRENCAAALAQAVSMDDAEAKRRMRQLGDKVEGQTRSVLRAFRLLLDPRGLLLTSRSFKWGLTFLRALKGQDGGAVDEELFGGKKNE